MPIDPSQYPDSETHSVRAGSPSQFQVGTNRKDQAEAVFLESSYKISIQSRSASSSLKRRADELSVNSRDNFTLFPTIFSRTSPNTMESLQQITRQNPIDIEARNDLARYREAFNQRSPAAPLPMENLEPASHLRMQKEGDEKRLAAFQEISTAPGGTVRAQIVRAWRFGAWVRQTYPGEHDLTSIVDTLANSGGSAGEHPIVQAYIQHVGPDSSAGEHIVGALNTVSTGQSSRKIYVEKEEGDENLITLFKEASKSPKKTVKNQIGLARAFGAWVRQTYPGEYNLTSIVAALANSGGSAREHPIVQVYIQQVSPDSWAGKRIVPALDAMKTGQSHTYAKRDKNDEKRLAAFQKISTASENTVRTQVGLARTFGAWVRQTYPGEHDLTSIVDTLASCGGSAREHPIVQAYIQHVGPDSSTGKHIVGVLNAVSTGQSSSRIIIEKEENDENLLTAFKEISKVLDNDVKNQVWLARAFGAWVRQTYPGEYNLTSIVAALASCGGSAREHPIVQAYIQHVGPDSSTGKYIVGALNAVSTGQPLMRTVSSLRD